MNQREKILAILVGAVVAVLGVKFIFLPIFLGSLNEENRKIESIRKEIEKNNRQLEPRNRLIREWRSVSQRTLSDDPEQANLILGERITSLLTASGLHDVSKSPVPISPTKTSGVTLYTPVAVNLSGKGTLAQFVKFLELFYQEPYIVKIKGFTLRPEGKGDQMVFSTVRIETIIPAKPVQQTIPPVTSRPVVTATQPVLKTGPVSQYALVVDRNIFRPYQAPVPPPIVKPIPTPAPVATRDPGPINQRPTDPNGRPGDVVATLAVGKQLAGYIRNFTGARLYKVTDKLENGMTLEFVHPLGLVVQDSKGKTLYVEIGGNIDQAAPLTSEAIPELYEAWKKHKGQ